METVNQIIGILANWWQVLAGLFVLAVYFQKKYRLFSRLLAHFTRPDVRAEVLSNTWRVGLTEIDRLNTSDAKLYSMQTTGMPRLNRLEGEKLASTELPWITRPDILTARSRNYPRVNKSHAFAVGYEFRQPGQRVIRFVSSDYAMVRAARDAGINPPILSANAIIFCPTTKQVLIHLRAPRVATYPNALHFLGGNYEPGVELEKFDDVDSASPLRQAAIREVKEESGLTIPEPSNAIVFIGEELTSGFVQFTYAGISVDSNKDKVSPGPEGGVDWYSLSDLVRFAETGSIKGGEPDALKIVPSFAINLLMWLKLGAPDEMQRTPIRDAALEAYAAILPHMHKRLAPYKKGT